ncbi:MAG: threonine/serine dehydratase, partial [Chloroflexota bacterium]|nr:threonine/serine dehydratase [Chloroflexota bacterium]
MEAGPLVTLDEIRRAGERLRSVALHTPLLAWDETTWLKPESLQPVGSFKIRGAYNKIAMLTDVERSRGVITYSSGNHAQGVARAARLLGVPATIVMPDNAPAVKVAGVDGDGARIVRCGPSSDERRALAERLAETERLTLVPPYDDADVIAGQGTIGLEIVADLRDVTSVLVPVGGGGLSSGVATAVKELRPAATVVGVEPEVAADARDSLRAGRVVAWPAEAVARTMADGMRAQQLGTLPFAHLRRYLDDIVTVTEDEIADAVRGLARTARLVVEPSGATALA